MACSALIIRNSVILILEIDDYVVTIKTDCKDNPLSPPRRLAGDFFRLGKDFENGNILFTS